MSEALRVVFDDWSGGDKGHLSDFEAGRRDPIRYDSNNLIYDARQGALVPRRGLARLYQLTPGRSIVGLGFAGTPGADLWFAIRNDTTGNLTLATYGTDGGAYFESASFGVIPADSFVTGIEGPGSITYVGAPGIGVLSINHVAHTFATVVSGAYNAAIALYRDRLIVVSGNRVYFSNPMAFSTFGALSYFDVGAGLAIAFIAAQRGHLTILLTDGTWWVLTGIPAAGGGTLRRVSGTGTHPWTFSAGAARLLGDDRIAFTERSSFSPAFFDGAGIRVENERKVADSGSAAVARMLETDEALFRSDTEPGRVLLNRRGAWTRHTFNVGTSRPAPWVTSNIQGAMYFAGSNGADAAIYSWNAAALSLPGVGDQIVDQATGVPPVAYLTLPEWWSREARQVLVRSVVVDFLIRNDGYADGRANLTCMVRSLQQGTNTAAVALDIDSTVQVASIPALDGAVRRGSYTFAVGDQGHGRGFQVFLSDIQGLAVQRVTVHLLADPPVDGR